jgi:hypothetical protein
LLPVVLRGMLLRNRTDMGLRKMSGSPDGDGDVVAIDGDFLTVEQVAQLRQVTPAAIRAQLRAGNLAGEQVLQGQRTVWRIPVGVARRYLDKPGGSSAPAPQQPAAPSTGRPASARSSASGTVPDPEHLPWGSGRGASGASASAMSGRVEALESEVRRLRRQLSALAQAHRQLLEAVTSDLAEDRLR